MIIIIKGERKIFFDKILTFSFNSLEEEKLKYAFDIPSSTSSKDEKDPSQRYQLTPKTQSTPPKSEYLTEKKRRNLDYFPCIFRNETIKNTREQVN
jgi:hypothetical protein